MRLLVRFLGFLFAAGTVVFLVGVAAAAGLIWHFSKDLPDYSQLQDYEPPVMTRVHAADGSLLGEYSKERRLYLPIQAVPKLVINAFLAAEVHIVGARRWNRRGAMVTDRYQHVRHHPTLEAFSAWAREAGLPVLGIDNLPGSVAIDSYGLPRACVLLFGQEGPGLSEEARSLSQAVLAIRQFGSTRSINAAAASAVAMHEWVRRWAPER